MELTQTLLQVQRKTKAGKGSAFVSIRVSKETRKRILQDLAKLEGNREFGGRVKASDYVLMAVGKMEPVDLLALAEKAMSGMDRLKREHKEYVAKHGPTPFGDFAWKLASGATPSGSTAAESPAAQKEGGGDA